MSKSKTCDLYDVKAPCLSTETYKTMLCPMSDLMLDFNKFGYFLNEFKRLFPAVNSTHCSEFIISCSPYFMDLIKHKVY